MALNSVESAINKVKAKGTVQRVFGWILAIFNGFIAFVGCATSGFKEALDVTMVLFFSAIAAAGVWLIIKGILSGATWAYCHNTGSSTQTIPNPSR